MTGHKTLTPQQFAHGEAARDTWQFKLISIFKGNQSIEGCILIAALNKTRAHHAPQVGFNGVILPDGGLVTNYVDEHGHLEKGARLPLSITQLIEQWQRACDTAKLSDPDRLAAFEVLRKWVYKDMRVKPEYDVSKGY